MSTLILSRDNVIELLSMAEAIEDAAIAGLIYHKASNAGTYPSFNLIDG